MPVETLVDKAESLAESLAGRFEAEGRHAVAARGRFTVALPGGSVATSFFPRLARVPFDWSRTDFFWGDERGCRPTMRIPTTRRHVRCGSRRRAFPRPPCIA